MDRTTKTTLWLITFGVLLFAAAMNFNIVLQFLQKIIGLIFPIILGLIIAFVLNVPMSGFERRITRIFARLGRKPKDGAVQGICLLLTLACIALVIALALTMAIPALTESIGSVFPLIREKWPEWVTVLKSYQIDLSVFTDWVESLSFENILGRTGNLFDSAVKVASTTISGVASTVFGLVIAIYVLLSKKKLAFQTKKLAYAHLDKKIADYICRTASLVREVYSKFLSGQCIEAIILGCLIFLAFSIFKLPYAGLVAFITGLCAFIPYIGAFISCFLGAFLALLADPSKALLCIAVYLVVQFVENQFIYPHVVGNSVGLAPLWTLIAALIGGKLFGVVGIIFFIPLFAVLYILVRENTNKKLQEKNIVISREK